MGSEGRVVNEAHGRIVRKRGFGAGLQEKLKGTGNAAVSVDEVCYCVKKTTQSRRTSH